MSNRASDMHAIATNFDDFTADMAKEFARYQKAYRNGRGGPRRTKAKMHTDKIGAKFGLSTYGHQPLDHITGMMVLGSLNYIENPLEYAQQTVTSYLAGNGFSVAPLAVRLKTYRTELTPAGEQAVIPGCEIDAAPSVRQLSLF